MELVKDQGPLIRLTDVRDQLRTRIPYWLAPATLPMPPATPALDYDCLLFGAPPVQTLSAHYIRSAQGIGSSHWACTSSRCWR